ncbi:MAG: protein CrcB [Ferruginibacter sp.]|nr:protein CrcB [Ferruginibacter sp.]
MWKQLLVVGIGGALGSMLRFLLNTGLKNQQFPLTTLLINIIGSFAIGAFAALSLKNTAMSDTMKLFFMTGICGGFTTFSAFSLENIQLIQQGKTTLALLYILLSIIGGLLATWLAIRLVN